MFLTELIIIRFTETIYYTILSYLDSENQKVVGWVGAFGLEHQHQLWSFIKYEIRNGPGPRAWQLPLKVWKTYFGINTLQLILRGPD